MHLQAASITGNSPQSSSQRWLLLSLAVIYFALAFVASWQTIAHTQKSTDAIEHILSNYNMKNEGAMAVDRYTQEHPVLGSLFGGPMRHELNLPSSDNAADALHSQVRQLVATVQHEAGIAAWWSWGLLNLSLAYIIAAVTITRRFTARFTIFACNTTALACFVIGVLAPAMIIWTAPTIPMESGQLSFVLQHQVRGIASIIRELLTTGHWIVGGFLLLFSIVTPLTKCSLTYFATASGSRETNYKIGELLHFIGKWSMADVFVAGVLLSMFALKAQEATKSIPCLGLYYFIGYCLISMTTTELLSRSHLVAPPGEERKPGKKITSKTITILLVIMAGFTTASTLYTLQQYTLNMHKSAPAPSTPQELNNANLVLPAHK